MRDSKFELGDIVMAFTPDNEDWGIHPHLILGELPQTSGTSKDPQYILLDSKAYAGTSKHSRHSDVTPYFLVGPEPKQNGLKVLTGFNVSNEVKRIQLNVKGVQKIGSLSNIDLNRFKDAEQDINNLISKIEKDNLTGIEYAGQIIYFNLDQENSFKETYSISENELKRLKSEASNHKPNVT